MTYVSESFVRTAANTDLHMARWGKAVWIQDRTQAMSLEESVIEGDEAWCRAFGALARNAVSVRKSRVERQEQEKGQCSKTC